MLIPFHSAYRLFYQLGRVICHVGVVVFSYISLLVRWTIFFQSNCLRSRCCCREHLCIFFSKRCNRLQYCFQLFSTLAAMTGTTIMAIQFHFNYIPSITSPTAYSTYQHHHYPPSSLSPSRKNNINT